MLDDWTVELMIDWRYLSKGRTHTYQSIYMSLKLFHGESGTSSPTPPQTPDPHTLFLLSSHWGPDAACWEWPISQPRPGHPGFSHLILHDDSIDKVRRLHLPEASTFKHLAISSNSPHAQHRCALPDPRSGLSGAESGPACPGSS